MLLSSSAQMLRSFNAGCKYRVNKDVVRDTKLSGD